MTSGGHVYWFVLRHMMVDVLRQLVGALLVLMASAFVFTALALVVRGKAALRLGRRAAAELHLNLWWYLVDTIGVAPLIVLAAGAVRLVIRHYSLDIVNEDVWSALGTPVTAVASVFIGDGIGYWRHRLEHTRWMWPAHAIHHSDTEMNWLTLARFHPVNRLTTGCIDACFLAMLGLPLWAIAVGDIVRHYYGELIHADLPWTFGRLGSVFVSPVMHQWHHARDVIGAGSNFATVFSVFDRAFGTYHVPGPCNVPLGVTDDIGSGLSRQFMYPFACWFKGAQRLAASRRDDTVTKEA
jgi:sterol desaturase/sphingolipid hydroxylase (fatty acid hydroxylase superfamily)